MSDYLPTDLLIEILKKLSVKSLIRFTTVSKSWRSIITSAAFIASHLSNAKHQTLLLRRRSYEDDKREHYSLLQFTEDGPFGIHSSSQLEFSLRSAQAPCFRVVGCCDGLVCLSDDIYGYSQQPLSIIIWNPSVRNHIVLPNPTINATEPYGVVLGFGVVSHAYVMVVRLVYPQNNRLPPQVEIFYLKTRSWRRLNGVDVSLRALNGAYCRAFLNGVLHWLADDPIDDNTCRSTILAFDIGDEVFGEVVLPDELARDASPTLSIFVIEKSLGIVKNYTETGASCDVWMMKEYCVKESWTKLYTIGLEIAFEEVVAFWKSDELLLALRNHRSGFSVGLFAYNPGTTIKDLGIDGTSLFRIYNYVESLLLLRGHI